MRWLNPPYIIGQFCQIHFYLPDYYRIEFFLCGCIIRAEHHPHGRICTGLKQTGYAAEQIQMIRFMWRHRSIITQCDRSRDSVASLVSKFGRDHRVIVIAALPADSSTVYPNGSVSLFVATAPAGTPPCPHLPLWDLNAVRSFETHSSCCR